MLQQLLLILYNKNMTINKTGYFDMKKIISICLLASLPVFPAHAQENTNNFSEQTKEIIAKCGNDVSVETNLCLKKEIINIISEVFKDEESEILIDKTDEIENMILNADFNMDDPQVKAFSANKEIAEQIRQQKLNMAWKEMLNNLLTQIDASDT